MSLTLEEQPFFRDSQETLLALPDVVLAQLEREGKLLQAAHELNDITITDEELTTAVLDRSKAYLATLKPADMDRVLDESQWREPVTVGIRLVSVINDNTEHAGQINYLRGLFQGLGWQRF